MFSFFFPLFPLEDCEQLLSPNGVEAIIPASPMFKHTPL